MVHVHASVGQAVFYVLIVLFFYVNSLNAFSGGIVDRDMVILYQKEAYTINATIMVQHDTILTIEPGVTLQFAENCSMVIHGALVAKGKEMSQITFRSLYGKKSKLHLPRSKTARLVGGDGFNEGRLEVFYKGVWGTVCSDHWTDVNTFVACRELGFVRGKLTRKFGNGNGTIRLTNVRCRLKDNAVIGCNHSRYRYDFCGKSAVGCSKYFFLVNKLDERLHITCVFTCLFFVCSFVCLLASVFFFVCQLSSLFVCRIVCLYVCLFVCIFCLFVCHLFTKLFICILVYINRLYNFLLLLLLSVSLTACLPVCLSACLPVSLFVCLF